MWPLALADCALNVTVRERKGCFTLCVLKCEATSSSIELLQAHEDQEGKLLLPGGQLIETEGAAYRVLCHSAHRFPDQGIPV